MVGNSLELIDTQLARRVEGESTRRLRKIAVAVSRLAVNRTGLGGSPILEVVLGHIDAQEPVPAALKRELTKFAEDLDEQYLALLPEEESGGLESDAVLPLFEKARAAAAVVFACDSDAFKAATESSYEAWAAIGEDTESLRKLISEALDEP